MSDSSGSHEKNEETAAHSDLKIILGEKQMKSKSSILSRKINGKSLQC